MAMATPRRSQRIPHMHTPKMSERKKSLFQSELSNGGKLSRPRLAVVESESDSECDLGIISTLDTSSSDEMIDQSVPKTPNQHMWRPSRSNGKIHEKGNLKEFIKSPFMLQKCHSRVCSHSKGCITSTPGTPQLEVNPLTPSSSNSTHSNHTFNSDRSRARKSLASIIADTESCSSSLKDLTFDTDSGTDTKENSPTKSLRKSSRSRKMTPKFASFKGVLVEQQKNNSSPHIKKPDVGLTTDMEYSSISPTKILETPQSKSPSKMSHRKLNSEMLGSFFAPFELDKSCKRLRSDSFCESAPISKQPKLDGPKARLSLFNDKLKEMLSAKNFYSKSKQDLNSSLPVKVNDETIGVKQQKRLSISFTHRRKGRKFGEINTGVRHKIKKPRFNKNQIKIHSFSVAGAKDANVPVANSVEKEMQIAKETNLGFSHEREKGDPFSKEHQTIDKLLSQWTEEEIPASENLLGTSRNVNAKIENTKPLLCFNQSVMEENPLNTPVVAIPVNVNETVIPESNAVIVELEPKNSNAVATKENTVCEPVSNEQCDDIVMGDGAPVSSGSLLPVNGGFIVVDENALGAESEEVTDLDAIERELQMLDDQLMKMVKTNNINPEIVLSDSVIQDTAILTSEEMLLSSPTTEGIARHYNDKEVSTPQASSTVTLAQVHHDKLFPIFTRSESPATPKQPKVTPKPLVKKSLLKTLDKQYIIDAGQKKFGATQCPTCTFVYEIGDPQEEKSHSIYHGGLDILKYNSFKGQCEVGSWDEYKCIRIRGCEPQWKKVDSLLERVIHPELGYTGPLSRADYHFSYTAYLYVDKKQILGCAILEPKSKAFKLLPGEVDCCSVEDFTVKCGVSRLWTHAGQRRKNIATRLLDCARASYLYGAILTVQDIAFSAPTPQGKAFATKYTGTENFFVYLD